MRNPVIPFILIMVLGIGLVVMLSIMGLGDAEEAAKEKEGGSEEKTEQTVATPEELYQDAGCIGCHGGNFEGVSGPSLLGVGDRLSVDEVKDVIANGRGTMPPNLIAAENLDAMAEYIHGLK